MHQLFDYFLHLQYHLEQFIALYGAWVYGLLFLVIFCETGLVVTPFLPGDSLLFATGALAASTNSLDIRLTMILLAIAAILGDAANYSIGHFTGPRVFCAEDRKNFWHRLLNRDHLMQAHAFFERHGGKAIVLGRFVPIVRTFVPFVAGAGSMSYPQFAFFNVTGALLWVGLCLGAGYAFGNVPVVKNNFEMVIIGIIAVSVAPIAWGYFAERRKKRAAAANSSVTS
jgi:membrane-associated protein